MFMNIIVILFVLGIAYTWMTRGVFNSMLHALCVFISGAIAFAVWEPLTMVLLGLSESAVVEGAAWGVSLIVPFVITMLVLRVITDKLVKANIRSLKAVDYAGGAAFGLLSSIITAGILIIGIGYMRLPSTFLGYQPVWYEQDRIGSGSLVKNQSLWIPVDTLTSELYQNLSAGSMSTAEPLQKWYPDLTLTGFAARINQGDGSARNAIHEDAFKVVSSYTIGNTNGSSEKADTIGDQGYVDIDGGSVGAGYLAGYVIEFGPQAKEKGSKGGQVVVSNGQIRLLTEHSDGSTHTIFPLAVISESSEQGKYGRWQFDSDDLFISSTGGQSRVPMGFEFFVPADERPLALYVKNIRIPAESIDQPRAFESAPDRNKLVQTGSLLTGKRVQRNFELADAVLINDSDAQSTARFAESVGTVMPSQLVKQRGIKIDKDNFITGGKATFRIDEIGRKNTAQTKKLRVDKFGYGDGLAMIQIKVGSGVEGGFLSEATKNASNDDPFMLIDTKGNEYEAVGFVYEDENTELFEIRYTPGSTLRGMNESGLPRISRSKDGQNLTLLFLISTKVDIQYYTIGDVVQMHFEPALSK